MAVVNIKSLNVQNADSAVQTLNPVHLAGAKKYSIVANAAIAAADDDGSTIRLCRVHSSWRLTSVLLYNEAIAASAGWTLGLYRTAADGGAAVAAACYATALAATAASLSGTQLIFNQPTRTIDKIGQQVWQDAGLAADPNLWYDLTFVCTTAGTAAGKIAVEVEYIAGSS